MSCFGVHENKHQILEVEQRKPKIFKQPEAKCSSFILQRAVGVTASSKQEMCTEAKEFIIFKS